jgi:hypothetical protein
MSGWFYKKPLFNNSYEFPFHGRIREPVDQSGSGPDRKNSGIQGLRGKSGSHISIISLIRNISVQSKDN